MIYLDYNATTPLCEPARVAMRPYLEEHFGNPSSVHQAGRVARAAIDNGRDELAALLRVRPNELIFTASGTEANNLAVLGLARAHAPRGRHLICSTTEHHAVLHAFEQLQKQEGFEVTWLEVDERGLIDPKRLEKALRPDTILASIMLANNETGVIQSLGELAEVCRAAGALFHSDMVQAFGKIDCDLALVDAASFAAHKFYGPKGAGFLYLSAGLPLERIQFGGAHENQRRPGTENVAAIAGMAAAAQWTLRDCAAEQEREAKLRDRLWERIAAICPDAVENGDPTRRLANTLNVSFPEASSETLLMALDLEGVCASSGSACMVGSVTASHVLLAMGFPAERAAAAVRFSLGKENTAEEIECAADAFETIWSRLERSRATASPTFAVS